MNARAVVSLKEFIEKRIIYEQVLLKWMTRNMTNEVIHFINPTPSYDLYRHAIYYDSGNFDYMFKLLEQYAIKYKPFNDEFITFSISKNNPNSLNYWLYFDMKTNSLECIDIPGEYLLLMMCFDIAKNILKTIDYGKATDKPKEVIEQIIDNYDIENPQYVKFLKTYQYKLFNDFLNSLKLSMLADEDFINDIFNINNLMSKYDNNSRFVIKGIDGIQGLYSNEE